MSNTIRSTATTPACRWLCVGLLSFVSLVAFVASSAAQRRMQEDPLQGPCGTSDCDQSVKKLIPPPVREPRGGGGRGRLPVEGVKVMVELLKARILF